MCAELGGILASFTSAPEEFALVEMIPSLECALADDGEKGSAKADCLTTTKAQLNEKLNSSSGTRLTAKSTYLKCIRVGESDCISFLEWHGRAEVKLVGVGIVGVRRVGLTIVTYEIRFGEEGARTTPTRSDLKRVYL